MCAHIILADSVYIKKGGGALGALPPAGVGGAAVLQDVIGAQRHDGPHVALEALL